MKIFKRVLLILVAIVVILLVVALFVKKDYAVEREVTINKSQAEMFSYLKYLKNQNDFSKWAKLDPAMKTAFNGTDGTIGFVSSWEGNKDVGKGEQEIKKINEGSGIETEIRFIKPWESVAQGKMWAEGISENQSKVKWSFSGRMPYPFNLMRLVGMEKMVGNDLETGLGNLKTLQEKR